MLTTRRRRIVRRAVMALAGGVLLVAGFSVYGQIRHVRSSVEDFSALWETHDLVQKYVRVRGDMPKSWDDLAPYFSEIDAGYGISRLEYLQDRIALGTDWNSRAIIVRSGNQEEEERQANQRIAAALRSHERAVE